MKTPSHFLRLEGANLGLFLGDTQDLSTVRGAGLLLLDAVKFAGDFLKNQCGVEKVQPISEGASVGFYEVQTSDIARLCVDLRAALAADADFQHVTFLVDALPADGEFRSILERLLVLNRTRQLREPSLVLPAWNENPKVQPDVKFDRMQPATETTYLPAEVIGGEEKIVHVSRSTLRRRDHGRDQRRQLYSTLQVSKDNAFTDDLKTLSAGPDYGWCADKVAVLYADGNAFGKIIRRHCATPELLRAFDREIREKRQHLLTAIIAGMGSDTNPDKRWWTVNRQGQPVRRVETLLWGGDELIWVVPAWVGWELAANFFAWTKDWTSPPPISAPPDGSTGTEELTHAAGLVFASHKAPIQRLVALARNLAQLAKDTINAEGGLPLPAGGAASFRGRDRNLLAYEVLESFDFTPDNVSRNRRRMLEKSGLTPGHFLLPGAALGSFQHTLRALEADQFPQRQLHEQTREILRGISWETTLKGPDLTAFSGSLEALAKSLAPFPPAAVWPHLAQLWNYVARVPAPPAAR